MDRTYLAVLAALALAFSGCLAEDPDGEGSNVSGTENGAGEEEAPAPVLTEYTCHVDSGGAVVSASGPAGDVGGCALTELAGDAEYYAEDIPEGCSVQVDLDGDDLADEDATIGKTYNAGHTFTAFCEAGVVDVDVTITLAT